MTVTPLFFSSNLIFGRGVVGEVAPFTLAFLRWLFVAMALVPVLVVQRGQVMRMVRTHSPVLLVEGFLGMWICGAIVYVALTMTTATNGTLIYTTSPVMIIILEALFFKRPIGWREALGSLIAFAGVAVIVLKGDVETLASLTFNPGDLLFILAALAWAIYSVLMRRDEFKTVGNIASLGLVAGFGAACLAPFALAEFLSGAAMPVTVKAWSSLAGIVFCASLIAFGGFQFGVRVLGPSVAAVFMYLLPPYGVTLAVLVLGETFHAYHAAGIVMVMGGIILATFPVARFRSALTRKRRPQAA
ncbi:EamA family transporter [Zhengella mangrovi]|uniref:EamA family transporter n=1 Tax=Zhengella mangrovi TaxID=1982044 RepID=A0A2G1QQU6_9HYPH|nr:DMT family transporter [Zhengella mangrovi]PHP67840.1 EamA family transporter [Zhengella mangrovi]